MPKLPAGPIGPWPALPPWPRGTVVALALDGSLSSATLAAWLDACGQEWIGLLVSLPEAPRRALDAARQLAGDRRHVTLPLPAPLSAPVGWALAVGSAREAGADWLALAPRDTGGAPLPLRLAAAEEALRADGFGGLYAPLWGFEGPDLGRLAIALGVSFEQTWDCQEETRCNACPACLERARTFRILGLMDPLAVDATIR